MRTPDVIPSQVRQLQRAVADPDVSAWVAANAGSGKTHVLAQRVINLLLKGVEPEKILCITFTKAAAANMAKRVFDTLARMDHARRRGARRRDPRPLEHRAGCRTARAGAAIVRPRAGDARRTESADHPRLLHATPAPVSVRGQCRRAVSPCSTTTEQTQLLEQLTLAVLLDGARAPDGPLGRALAIAMTAAADQTFRDVVRGAIDRRDTISRWVIEAGDVDAAIAALSRALGLNPADTRESVEEEFFAGSSIASSEWTILAAVLAQGGKGDADQARRFGLLASLSRSDRVETYLDIFCTSDARSPRKTIVTRAIKDAGLVERLAMEQGRVCALLDRLRAVICRDRSAALLTVAYEVLTRYQDEKARRGLLDYDDLIDKSLALLGSVDAAWVHYKLDLGIDHLLIDEAQDTSSKQWEIVRRLVAEFTAGAGARSAPRTIFAVGDEKQSIYSFQNAAPKEFAEMRRYFERRS